MDLQFWIWVIVIVITLIARANKKKPAEQPPPDDYPEPLPPTSTSRPPPKAITFEDLLREIQGEKMASKPVMKTPEPKKYDFLDYDDDIKEEVEEFEDTNYETSREEDTVKIYEAAKREAFNRPSLEETSNLGEVVKFDHFKEYTQRKRVRPSFNFLKEIKDPNGFRKAFIMSEILNRKY